MKPLAAGDSTVARGSGTARRAVCDVCGFSAVMAAPSAGRCPNCGRQLGSEPIRAAGVQVERALSVGREPRRRAGVQGGTPLSALQTPAEAPPRDLRTYEPVVVEITRRLPAPGGGYRDNAEVSERIRIRHRVKNRLDLVMPGLFPGCLLGLILFIAHHGWSGLGCIAAGILAGPLRLALHVRKLRQDALVLHPQEVMISSRHVLPASRIRAVEHEDSGRGHRVLLVLDSGKRLTALDALSAHQAEYVAGLVSGTLGLA